jgi:inorganic pyrophosphatase
MDFWEKLDKIIAASEIFIDRPKGTVHPRFPDMRYPFDYGYLKDTSGGDGMEIDVCQGSLGDKRLIGVICTVDSRKKDTEVKLLIGCTEDEIKTVESFFNNGVMAGILIRRYP